MLRRLSLTLGITLSLSTPYLLAFEFRVMSYNVENLWDDDPDNTPNHWRNFIDSLSAEDRDLVPHRDLQYDDYSGDHSNWYNPEILDAKIQNLIQAIKLAGAPEILALQEIESAGNHSHVFDMHGNKYTLRQEFERLGYRYFILGHQNERNPVSVTQAIISKLPLKELDSVDVDFEDEPFSPSARDVQVVEFKDDDNRLVIFNNHWKSKSGGGKTEIPRIRTAELVKKRIEEEYKKNRHTRIIVLGDLNSAYYEKPIEILATADETVMLGGSTTQLFNTWYDVSEEQRWETSFRGKKQTLSAMLISNDFYQKSGIQYVDRSFDVVGHSGSAAQVLLTPEGLPYRWQIRKNKRNATITHLGKGYSDHLPLIATFKWESEGLKGKRTLSHIPFLKVLTNHELGKAAGGVFP